MKIFAVDDNPLTRDILTAFSATLGFSDVSTASSGEEALTRLHNDSVIFDCLLFDINMQGMDGVELCSLARAIPVYRNTPIIMLTSLTERKYIDRAFKAGATDYATKPFHIVELGARLRMAEEIIAARRYLPPSGAVSDSQLTNAANRHSFDLSDESQFDGFPNLIKYPALGNYLMQLSEAGLYSSQVLAVKIDQIEAIYARASPEEFHYALSEVADAISVVLKTSSYMMSYAGKGLFLIVMGKGNMALSDELETEIQNLLDEKNSEYDDGTFLDLDVSIGNPILPYVSKAQRAWMTFDRAVARAENRMSKKKNRPRQPSIRIIGR